MCENIFTNTFIIGFNGRPQRLNSTHFGKLHCFHQPVHSPVADVYAIITLKTNNNLMNTEPLIGLGINLKNIRTNGSVFKLSCRRNPIYELVISASVYSENAAKCRDGMLRRKSFNGIHSLSECGVILQWLFLG